MNRKWLIGFFLPVLVVSLVVGCKKKPVTPVDDGVPEEVETVETPTREVPPPAPPQLEDEVERDPLDSEDMAEVNREAVRQGFHPDVFFDFDKSDLRPEARQKLADNARWLNRNQQFVLRIEGHCDERGTNEYNLALGERRANAAKDYLVSLDVAAGRLSTISYGEERPVCTESTEACWQRNRRAHMVITGRR